MDVSIDTSVIEEGISGLSRAIESLSGATSDMQSCILSAKTDFDTINYDRANESISTANAALEQMQSNLNNAKEFLARLNDLIEQYAGLQY